MGSYYDMIVAPASKRDKLINRVQLFLLTIGRRVTSIDVLSAAEIRGQSAILIGDSSNGRCLVVPGESSYCTAIDWFHNNPLAMFLADDDEHSVHLWAQNYGQTA